MKRTIICILTAIICLFALNAAALADADDLILIIEPGGAVLYDSYDEDEARPIAVIPEGEVALHLATIDWGYCVTFGNYAGYIYEDEGIEVNPRYYDYQLPDGTDYSYDEDDDDWETGYVPEFPYEPIECYGIEKIATRSGPSGDYTWHSSYSKDIDLEILYQTENDGVRWCCLEFEAKNAKYRVYTSMRRIVVDEYVPDDAEDYVWAKITSKHTPRLGPGYEYASADEPVPAGVKVKAFYQQYGWLMYEYTLSNGEIQRGWAAPEYWK